MPNLNKNDFQSKGIYDANGVAPSLYSGDSRYGGGECYILGSVGFIQGNSAKARSDGAEEEKSPTIRSSGSTAVAYRKIAHPRNKDEGQGYEEAVISDTLNIFDLGETRTPTLVVDQGAGKSSCHVDEEVSPTLSTAHDGAPAIMEMYFEEL